MSRKMAVSSEGPGEWGPAMAALDNRRQIFVVELFENGGNATAAARKAGYFNKSETGVKVQAQRLKQNSKVQAAIAEYGQGEFRAHAPRLTRELIRMATGREKADVRLRAIIAGLAHGGMAPTLNVKHEHQHTLTYDEKIDKLQRLARLAGMDPGQAVAGLLPPVTDAEYEEV